MNGSFISDQIMKKTPRMIMDHGLLSREYRLEKNPNHTVTKSTPANTA